MLILVCGSRNWTDIPALQARIRALPNDTLIIQGGAGGADTLAKRAAVSRGLFVATVQCEPSHWIRHGRRAGILRNNAMLDLKPDLVIAFQRAGSRGTQYTVDEARRRGIPVELHTAT